MKIGVDIRPAQYYPARGFGRFTKGIVKGLQAVDADNEYLFFYDSAVPLPYDLQDLTTSANFRLIEWKGLSLSRLDVLFFSDLLRFNSFELRNLDIFFSPVPLAFPIKRIPIVMVIHDLNPVVWQKRKYVHYNLQERLFRLFSKANLYMKQKLEKLTAQKHYVVVPSLNTREDLKSYWDLSAERLFTIYEGVDESFRRLNEIDWSLLAELGLTSETPFFLYVGVVAWHKNVFGLVEAFSRLKGYNGLKLVLAGDFTGRDDRPSAEFNKLTRQVEKLGLEDRILFVGTVSDETLVNLYNAAAACVLVSFFEGFGLPVIEAMACGCPVIASKVSSLPEVGGDAVLYCDPHNLDSIATRMRQLLEQDGLRRQMREKGLEKAKNYTWEQSARRLIEFFEMIHEKTLCEKRSCAS